MSTKITDAYFEFGVHKYFRGNAHLLDILSFGQKRNPITGAPYVDPQGKVTRSYLTDKVTRGATISIDWAQASQKDVEVNGSLKVFGVGVSAGATHTYQQLKTGKVKLYNMFINEGPLIKLLNNDANAARNFLADEGGDARIVTEVFVCLEAELAEHFETSTGFVFSVPAVGLDLTAKGGSKGTQTITISAGTVFAYKLHKVTNWKDSKTVVDDMKADYYG